MTKHTEPVLSDGSESAERPRAAELLRNNETLRKEIARLREENARMAEKFAKLAQDNRADREFRKAALNLMEDAVRARQAAYAANEERRRAASKLEETIAQRTLALRATVSELEAFSYSIAHDMRAPLRTMRGFGEILLVQYAQKLDAPGQDYLRRITAAAERMDRLIQDVLDYSKIVRSEIPMDSVEIGPLLRGIIESYPQLSSEDVAIDIQEPLPRVMGNQSSLLQCLSNLLSNAVKFTPPGTKAQIRIWAESQDSLVRLFVKDNGIGIDPEHHQRIFNIFEQINRNGGGTGIGLAIVKKSMERMGGRVGVESTFGNGSTFWIELREGKNC
ncbi:MAG TPA: ATP-binding protein [Verrucomicrobiae bacterium]|jgi:signal transduction histidine kinase